MAAAALPPPEWKADGGWWSAAGAEWSRSARRARAEAAPPPRKKRWMCNFSKPLRAMDRLSIEESNPYFKQDICWFELMGGCKYGEACYFAHDTGELRQPSAQGPPMRKVRTRRLPSGHTKDGAELDDEWDEVVCPFFQVGCCWYGTTCVYKHEKARKDSGYRTSLCGAFERSGSCAEGQACFYAHGQDQLRTPAVWWGVPGYKASLCTFYMLEDLECGEDNCADAHGPLDLRRVPLSVPHGVTGDFRYSDAHVHLDHVLLQRKYGSCWFYKRTLCRYKPCLNRGCAWAHSEDERRWPLRIERADFEELAAEIARLPRGTCAGLVHSCCEVDTIEEALRLVAWGREAMGGRVYAAFGIHPTNFETYTPEAHAKLEAALDECGPQGIAWGECGLDYYRRWLDVENDPAVKEHMCDVFARQARFAVRRGLPLVVHSRDAEDDTLRVLRECVPPEHPVYLHSFMGSLEMMTAFLDGWSQGYVGIAGCVTYQAAGHLWELAEALPLGRLLLETDGPYMAPVPHRGEESHPGHVPWIAAGVAKAKGLRTDEVLAAGHANFLRFYGL